MQIFWQKYRCKRGSTTVSGTAMVFLLTLALAAIMTIAPVLNDIATVDRIANEVSRYVEIQGDTASAESEFARIKGIMKTNGDSTLQIDANTIGSSSRIQLDDEFTIIIDYETSIGIGGIVDIPLEITRKATGRSEKYWK